MSNRIGHQKRNKTPFEWPFCFVFLVQLGLQQIQALSKIKQKRLNKLHVIPVSLSQCLCLPKADLKAKKETKMPVIIGRLASFAMLTRLPISVEKCLIYTVKPCICSQTVTSLRPFGFVFVVQFIPKFELNTWKKPVPQLGLMRNMDEHKKKDGNQSKSCRLYFCKGINVIIMVCLIFFKGMLWLVFYIYRVLYGRCAIEMLHPTHFLCQCKSG